MTPASPPAAPPEAAVAPRADAGGLVARSHMVAERIDVRGFTAGEVLGRGPLTVRVDDGIAVVYRYGAVVFVGTSEEQRQAFLAQLPLERPVARGGWDDADLRLATDGETEGVGKDAQLVLRAFDLDRLRVVAEVLARSALLSHYEVRLAQAFEALEPRIERLRRSGRLGLGTGRLLRQIGEALDTEVRMVGRGEVSEKPELVWDRPELDALFVRLADEYELAPRDRALTRKLDLLTRVASLFVDALAARRNLQVEWAIVALIVVEIVLMF